MMLALTIDRYLGDPKCLPIAYRALRAAYDDPEIHLGYISMFLMGRIGRGEIDTPTEVGPDTAVVLVEKGEGRFAPRVVKVGARGGGFAEILDGLAEGERVVVGANFLIDAESNLKAALEGFAAGSPQGGAK